MSNPVARLTEALAGRYAIERELGAGGMATVYLAEDLRHHRKVAIKVLKPELAAVIGAERFLQEITTTAQLQHPNILALFDSGAAEVSDDATVGATHASPLPRPHPASFLYYVMPYIEGETLRGRLDRETQLGVAEAVRLTTEIADALQYAHARGIVHRDIKPENILLHAGRPMVADFGIALAVSAAAGSRMTETGLSLGTPHYMSPEQATAEKEITPRSDIYSLGSVLYEMLTGSPPHTGASAQQIIMKIVTEEAVPVAKLRKAVPPNVAAATACALEKLPADRFESARAFGEALQNPVYRASGGIAVAPTGARPSWLVPALGAIAALGVAVAAWRWLRPEAHASRQTSWRVTIALPDSASPKAGVAISRDGATVVYTAIHDGVSRLYRLTAASGRLEPIARTSGATYPAISPDGRQIAYHLHGGVFVQSLAEGTPRRVVERTTYATPATWLDNSHLLVEQLSGVTSVPVNGGQVQQLTTRDVAAGAGYHLYAAPLPPGDGIVFSILPKVDIDPTKHQIAAVGPQGGKPVVLTTGKHARFAPPNHLIVNRGDGTIVAIPFDSKRLRLTGAPVPLVSGLLKGDFTSAGLFDVAPSGRLVYLEGDDSRGAEIVRVDRTGAIKAMGNNWRGTFRTLEISPDGSRVALGIVTPEAEQIHVRDVATGSLTIISSAGAQIRLPAWAPNGRSLYFTALGTILNGLYRTVPGTSQAPEQLFSMPPDSVRMFSVPSADGRTLYFIQHAANENTWSLRSAPITGPDSSRVVAPIGAAPEPSPDGRWLAYMVRDEQGRLTLTIRSTDPTRDETWQVTTDASGRPRWSRDGTALYYVSGDSLRVASLAPGTVFRIASRRTLFALGQLDPDFDVGPDGQFIMIRRLPDSASTLHLVMLEDWKAAAS